MHVCCFVCLRALGLTTRCCAMRARALAFHTRRCREQFHHRFTAPTAVACMYSTPPEYLLGNLAAVALGPTLMNCHPSALPCVHRSVRTAPCMLLACAAGPAAAWSYLTPFWDRCVGCVCLLGLVCASIACGAGRCLAHVVSRVCVRAGSVHVHVASLRADQHLRRALWLHLLSRRTPRRSSRALQVSGHHAVRRTARACSVTRLTGDASLGSFAAC